MSVYEWLGNLFILLLAPALIHQVWIFRHYGAPIFSWVVLLVACCDCVCFALDAILVKHDWLSAVGELVGAAFALGCAIYVIWWQGGHQ